MSKFNTSTTLTPDTGKHEWGAWDKNGIPLDYTMRQAAGLRGSVLEVSVMARPHGLAMPDETSLRTQRDDVGSTSRTLPH